MAIKVSKQLNRALKDYIYRGDVYRGDGEFDTFSCLKN